MSIINDQAGEFEALRKLISAFRALPPIVDDDYPKMRHYYESAINAFLRAARNNGRLGETFSQKNLERCEAPQGFNAGAPPPVAIGRCEFCQQMKTPCDARCLVTG
jgi:hypothetical protein